MKKILYILLSTFTFISCDKYLDIEPVGQVIPKSVEEFRSFLTSAYSISKNHKVLTTYRGDELSLEEDGLGVEQYEDLFVWNDLNPSPLTTSFPYASVYNTIFYANHIINSESVIEGDLLEKQQLISEAYALRALQYFELINLYAKPYSKSTASTDAGVAITTVYDSEKEYPVSTVEEVYTLILSDLDKAEALMQTNKQAVGYNYRFSTLAVKAFKARVYLYQQEWQNSVDLINEALTIHSELQDLNTDVSIMPSEYNSVESILALENVAHFDMVTYATIATDLIEAYHPTEDLRLAVYFEKNTDGTYRSKKSADNKFKISYRTSELYLNLAEALAQLGQEDLAKETLVNFAQKRYTNAGWENFKIKVNALNSDDLLTEILEERRREFAIEGHRWNDLRRTTQPELIKTFDGVVYQLNKNDERYVIPFPTDAVINNPDL
ncbi:RagB/SusD family nutrient uptake outer membrane protein [Wenyingzhuangia sp. 2_MG-2023]|uniref:RagB/SusD family nutrient uptake outer membrane protein n=1 Tax=Wenyingzhuangia sp. 2_MG-2023 TaxID=3062639 RepID=UPI0026E2A882|nr:RagB/SusD family nutrient uptake outer membrane protein [Wenyingzhuangia sp. 2_MG-2023]MDO6738519.1 RagB/SusD family nutrient uptake outer membrane protein [Wenyingzhuangia sp. 2_MG-2023]